MHKASYDESVEYCEFLGENSRLYEPQDADTRNKVLAAIKEEAITEDAHYLGIGYYVNFLGHLASNGFQLKRIFGTYGN